MFSNALNEHRRSLAFRLTLWYAGIFAISSIAAFSIAYLLLVSGVQARTDADLIEDIDEISGMYQAGGLERVAAEVMIETQGGGSEQAFFRFWSSQGEELLSTDLGPWVGLGVPSTFPEEPQLETLDLPDRDHRVRIATGRIAPDVTVQLGESLETDEAFAATLRNGFLVSLICVVLMGIPIGWFLASRALRGVRKMTQTATEIADGDLDRRVTAGGSGDELDALALAFNKMLDRIQALIIGMREMTDNLAHDFRSPLGRIRASAETSLAEGTDENLNGMVASTVEECDRLLEMINTTLDIAEAESGAAKLAKTEVNLALLVRDAVELFQPVSEDRAVALTAETPAECSVFGDLQRLQRAVANLIDNAIKYTPSGGSVSIQLVDKGDHVEFSVEDDGIGMSAAESSKIFERFYRCERSRSERGNGLGLSLALAFFRAHGGTISVVSGLGEGSRFTAVLPRRGTAARA